MAGNCEAAGELEMAGELRSSWKNEEESKNVK